jgi:transcriptional regulatory protein LevR
LQELDYQIQVTLLSLNQLLSQEGLDQLDSQKKTMAQVIQHQENKNQLLQTLLDELNEGVKKKIPGH